MALYTVSSGSVIQSQDINQFVTAFPVFNVKSNTAAVDGSTDDIAPITNTIAAADAAGGGFVFIPGTCAISTPVNLNTTNPVILCSTVGGGLKATSGFTGAEMVNITKNFCGVRDMVLTGGPSVTYSSNPATNGIAVTGAVGVNIENVFMQYINGWGVLSTATSGQANYNLVCDNVHVYSSKQAFKSLGVTGSNYNGVQHFNKCNADLIQGGDCYHFEDVEDILCTNILGSCTAGTGNALDIKGACSAIWLENVDLGPYPGPSTGAAILVESGANGSPNMVSVTTGIVEGGTSNISISAGTQISFINMKIFNAGTYGVNITGGDDITFEACMFSGNGSAGTTGRYDWQSNFGGHAIVRGCYFLTPQGSTAGHTNNVVNAISGVTIFEGCPFYGTGYNSGNIFNNYPYIIRNCPGYNPLGALTPPTITASPFTAPVLAQDATYYITGGTVSSIKVGGTATNLTSGTFYVKAQQSITITYTGAPTIVLIAD